MNVTMKKSIMAAAVAMAFVSTGAHAAAVTGFKIMDIGQTVANTGYAAGSSNNATNYSAVTDGKSGAFAFKNIAGTDIQTKLFGGATLFTGDVGTGTINMLAANALGSFSTGFLFGTPTFSLGTSGPSTADITAGVFTTAPNMAWIGNYGGGPGGAFNNLSPSAGGATKVEFITAGANANEWKVAIQWQHTITTAEDPTATKAYAGQRTAWYLEGIMTTAADGVVTNASTVPVPAAAWLLGSGLVGLVGVARRRKAA